jgi:hypothetical protein
MLAALGALAGIAASAAAPGLADVRLGARDGAVTRVVLDLRGGAPFSYEVSGDGLTLTVALHAGSASPALPRRGVGLVRAVSAAPDAEGTRISIAAQAPVTVVQTGVLPPEGAYRFHRIYFDLGPAAAQPPAAAPVPAPVAESHPVMAAAEPPHGESHEVHEAHETREAHEAHHPEPLVTIKLGGTFERSVSDYTNSYGPTAGLQTGLFHDALEMELGTTALLRDGHANWKTGLIFKKPIEVSESVELAAGAGPLWFHRSHLGEDPEVAKDSAGVEGVVEMVFWPGEHRSLGFYAETGYSYDFGKGHEKAAGAGAGVLVPLP